MDDLISRQAAIDTVKKNTFRLTFAEEQNCEGHVAWSADAAYSDVIEGALLELPSTEIIFCEECKHAERDDMFHDMWCRGRKVKPGHYCGYAERKENTNEDNH